MGTPSRHRRSVSERARFLPTRAPRTDDPTLPSFARHRRVRGAAAGVCPRRLPVGLGAGGRPGSSGSRYGPGGVWGIPCPDFSLESYDGGVIRLSEFRGKKDVILVFYRGYW